MKTPSEVSKDPWAYEPVTMISVPMSLRDRMKMIAAESRTTIRLITARAVKEWCDTYDRGQGREIVEREGKEVAVPIVFPNAKKLYDLECEQERKQVLYDKFWGPVDYMVKTSHEMRPAPRTAKIMEELIQVRMEYAAWTGAPIGEEEAAEVSFKEDVTP